MRPAAPAHGTGRLDLDARLRFERFVTGIAARLLELPAETVEQEVLRSLEGLLDALDVDRCGISLFDDSTPDLVTRLSVSRPGVPTTPAVDLAPLLPWYAGEVRAGRTLAPRSPAGGPSGRGRGGRRTTCAAPV